MKNKVNKNQIKQIAREYGRTKGAEKLSKELNISRQAVQQIAGRLRKAGINIPIIKHEIYLDIAEELRKESPELFELGKKFGQKQIKDELIE